MFLSSSERTCLGSGPSASVPHQHQEAAATAPADSWQIVAVVLEMKPWPPRGVFYEGILEALRPLTVTSQLLHSYFAITSQLLHEKSTRQAES